MRGIAKGNIALLDDMLAVSCILPRFVLLTDRKIKPLKRIDLRERPNTVYEMSRSMEEIISQLINEEVNTLLSLYKKSQGGRRV